MTITRAAAKSKGRNHVKNIKEILLQNFPELQPDDIMIPSGSQPGNDLQLSPRAQELIPFGIEAKFQEKLNIHDAIKQCEANTKAPNIPLVLFKRSRTAIYATLKFSDLLELLPKS